MTVISLERYPVAHDAEERFRNLIEAALARMRSAGGVLWADAAKAFDDEPSYIVVSEWRSTADLDAWDESDAAGAFRADVDVLLRGEVLHRRFADA